MENDQELVRLCQQGDDVAFEQLFKRYGRRVYALAYRFTSNPQEAEDIQQTAFLRAYEHIVGNRGIRNFYPWLCRVTVNLAADYHRASHPHELLDTVDQGLQMQSRIMSPDTALENLELGEKIDAAIRRLPARQKEVFLLKTVSGLCHSDIAAALGCTQTAVRANLYQALSKLRESLRKYIQSEGEVQ